MRRQNQAAGFTLIEALVALFLAGLAILAAAPMFMHAAHSNEAGADMGTVGALALDRLEQLRKESLRNLVAGGDLNANLNGYSDLADQNFVVRWEILDNPSPSRTKTITVMAVARNVQFGPKRRVELTLIRGR